MSERSLAARPSVEDLVKGSKRSLLVASVLVSVALAATQWAGLTPPVLTGSD